MTPRHPRTSAPTHRNTHAPNIVDTKSKKKGAPHPHPSTPPGPQGAAPRPQPPATGDGNDWGSYARHRGAELADRHHRAAYPKQHLRSAYTSITGDNPDMAIGNLQTARETLRRIEQAIDRGKWTRAEWRRLHLMKVKWEARAAGRDLRWMMKGTHPSGLTSEESTLIRAWKMAADIRKMAKASLKSTLNRNRNRNSKRQG